MNLPQKPKVVELYAMLNFDKQEVKAKPIFNNAWDDFGLYLEVAGFMAARALNETKKSKREILEYINDYVDACIDSYANKESPYTDALLKTIDENQVLPGDSPMEVPGVHDDKREDEDNGSDLL